MKTTWFKKVGWLHLPVHATGYIITLLAIAFIIPACLAGIRNNDSVGDELFQIFIYFNCTTFWWKWVAEKTSEL